MIESQTVGTNKEIIRSILHQEYPFAVWKLPGKARFNVIADLSEEITILEEENIDKVKGFTIAPFDTNKQKPLLIKPDILITEEEEVVPYDFNLSAPKYIRNKPKITLNSDSAQSFKSLVKQEVESIKRGDYYKLVAARTKDIPLSNTFDPVENLDILAQHYPYAMVFYFFHPLAGHWMGATPETLIEIDQNKIFKTTALAGTQAYKTNTNLEDVAWTQKEIEEQALVSRYIINCFKKIRVREFEEIGPRSARAGNLVHLLTEFRVNMETIRYPEMGGIMLKLLHPTSAVCGMPKEEAMSYILKYEKTDRKYYSGYLGQLNIGNHTHLFVNLRSMQLFATLARLYAGAGITTYSNPEKEYEETEMKFDTLNQVIKF